MYWGGCYRASVGSASWACVRGHNKPADSVNPGILKCIFETMCEGDTRLKCWLKKFSCAFRFILYATRVPQA